MDITYQEHGTTLIADLSGKFTFADSTTFRQLLDKVEQNKPHDVVMQLPALEYVDSAALGMFLLLKDSADKTGAVVTLKSPQGQVEKLLKLSCFDQIFSIAA